MKKLLGLIALVTMLICLLASCGHTHYFEGEWVVIKEATATENGEKARYCYCGEKQSEITYYTPEEEKSEDVISVIDGYVAINGVKTEYKVHTEPVVSVIDGYVAVNGIKTEHKVYTEPVVSEIDGFVAVNGIKTEYKIDKGDVVTVEDGYLVVNGTKTEYKVHTEPVVSIIDGYVAVNGIKTEHKVHTEPVISVIDGYVAVNGVKTDYLIATSCNHIWNTVTTAPTCTAGGYDTMTCPLCDKSVKVNETAPIAHIYETTYTIDDNYHWFKCSGCDDAKDKALHTLDDDGICTICDKPISATLGVLYDVSADGTYAEVIGYEGTATKVKIAEEYQGLPVEVIYEKAFSNTSITSVIIPDSVTSIDDFAFYYCRSLTSIVIGNSVASIGIQAFDSCVSLTSIVIPNSVTNIANSAFSNCDSSLFTEYEFGKYLHSGDNPYAVLIGITNKNMSSYTINENTKWIASNVFSGCSRLTSIVIPDSVTNIGHSAFSSCGSLISVVIGDSVTSISDHTFWYCSSLTSVVIGNSVMHIGNQAFDDCSSLTSIVIPNSVTSIGYKAFGACASLTSIVIPNSVTSIGDSSFSMCDSLTSIVIGDGVTSFGSWVFDGCSALSDVYYIGSEAEWNALSVSSYHINNATIHYNYNPEEN